MFGKKKLKQKLQAEGTEKTQLVVGSFKIEHDRELKPVIDVWKNHNNTRTYSRRSIFTTILLISLIFFVSHLVQSSQEEIPSNKISSSSNPKRSLSSNFTRFSSSTSSLSTASLEPQSASALTLPGFYRYLQKVYNGASISSLRDDFHYTSWSNVTFLYARLLNAQERAYFVKQSSSKPDHYGSWFRRYSEAKRYTESNFLRRYMFLQAFEPAMYGCHKLDENECCKYVDGRERFLHQQCVVVSNVVAPERDTSFVCHPANYATCTDCEFRGEIKDYCGADTTTTMGPTLVPNLWGKLTGKLGEQEKRRWEYANGVPDHTKVEVFHFSDRYPEGFWLYAHSGTGLYYDVGKSLILKNHMDNPLGTDKLSDAAKFGYDSIQYISHYEWGHYVFEIVDVRSKNKAITCPVNLSSYYRRDENGFHACTTCDEKQRWFNCDGFPLGV